MYTKSYVLLFWYEIIIAEILCLWGVWYNQLGGLIH